MLFEYILPMIGMHVYDLKTQTNSAGIDSR